MLCNDPNTEQKAREFDLDPDDDGAEVFVDHDVDEREDASVPKQELFQTYETRADVPTSMGRTTFGLRAN